MTENILENKVSFLDLFFNSIFVAFCSITGYIYILLIIAVVIPLCTASFFYIPGWIWFLGIFAKGVKYLVCFLWVCILISVFTDIIRVFIPSFSIKKYNIKPVCVLIFRFIAAIGVLIFFIITLMLQSLAASIH